MAFVQLTTLGVGGGGGTAVVVVVGGDGATGGTWAWTMEAMSAAMAIAAKVSLSSVKTFVAMASMTVTGKL